jgi:hypothetical protein
MSFLEKLQNSQGELVYLVRGKHEGREAWHYVLVEKAKLPFFCAKVKSGALDVANYGKILHSGYGKNPPEDIVASIKQQYN